MKLHGVSMNKNLIKSLSVLLVIVSLAKTVYPQHEQQSGSTLSGTVTDANRAAIVGAAVHIKNVSSSFERIAETDSEGRYAVCNLPLGSYLLTASSEGFRPGTATINIAGDSAIAPISLGTASLAAEVTVTAVRGESEAAFVVPESVSVIGAREIAERRAVIFPQLLQNEPGVAIQQTSSSQGSPFIRGLTGKQIITLIDGVRYNNSTFRPGPNQFTALIEPANAARVEVVRGPSALQYGSDSFGGTINVLTLQPLLNPQIKQQQGGVDLRFGSADLSGNLSGFYSAATKRTSFIVGGASHATQDLRTGRGMDSRSAAIRFLGLDAKTLGSRLLDTKFQQYAGFGKFIWTMTEASRLTLSFQHSEQHNARRYDELNGGNGNLIASFDPQTLNFFYARYERQDTEPLAGVFENLAATFSINSQRDDRRFQGGFGNPRRTISDEQNRTDAYGYTVQSATRIGNRQVLVYGAELYDEYVTSERADVDPLNDSRVLVRPRYPNGARYTSLGLFVQDSTEIISKRLRAVGGLRYSRFNYRQSASQNPFKTDGIVAVSDARVRLDDLTFNIGGVLQATDWLAVSGGVNRGFRAPNVSDFGAIGLTSSGFEMTAQEAKAAGAEFKPLTPETLYNYEIGLKIKSRRLDGSVKLFVAQINGLIERRNLRLPQGATGRTLGGQLITRQNPDGEVFLGLTPGAVQIRQNTSPVVLRGFEAAFRSQINHSWLMMGNAAYVRNNIRGTDEPARFQGFAPPWIGYIAARWQPSGQKFWIELYSSIASRQTRFSAEDVSDQRLGAARSRQDIAAFFRNGAVARGLVQADANGELRLVNTGETLPQVQNRVLPLGASVNGVTVLNDTTSVPLYTNTNGFATLNTRLGYRLNERHTILVSVENIFDKNYRINGSGIDSPGINAVLHYAFRF